jgi:hypothetical protein
MTSSEFASFVLAILVAQILFFGGLRALVEITDSDEIAIPVQAVVEEESPEEVVPPPPVPPE